MDIKNHPIEKICVHICTCTKLIKKEKTIKSFTDIHAKILYFIIKPNVLYKNKQENL